MWGTTETGLTGRSSTHGCLLGLSKAGQAAFIFAVQAPAHRVPAGQPCYHAAHASWHAADFQACCVSVCLRGVKFNAWYIYCSRHGLFPSWSPPCDIMDDRAAINQLRLQQSYCRGMILLRRPFALLWKLPQSTVFVIIPHP